MINFSTKFIVSNGVNDYDLVDRTWKERLWSWPWRPWVKTKSVLNPKILRIGDDYVCSPRTYEMIKHKIPGAK